ncbi:MAG: O-antigen ligase family protein [Flavobacteriales bacterium]
MALCLCAIFLPWSTAILSMAQMLLALNWFVDGFVNKDLCTRLRKGFTSRTSLVFISFFALHVIGLFWTSPEGMAWGLDLGRILFPVVVFSVILSGSERLTQNELRAILLFGAWSVVASTIICFIAFVPSGDGYREFSIFISHIRLSLLLCFAIVVFFHFRARTWIMVAQIIASLWALYVINRLGSIQGFMILFALGGLLLWRWLGRIQPLIRYAIRFVLIAVPLCLLFWIGSTVSQSYSLPDPAAMGAGEFTVGGEAYTYDATNPQKENGVYVWSYIAWAELDRTWKTRSRLGLADMDDSGHILYGTLFRYLSSKGLHKDSIAVMSLTASEVEAIERGVTHTGNGSKLEQRFSEVVMELGQYKAYGNADGHSVAMRLEFWKAGSAIAKANWLIGVGTGDTQIVFDEYYEAINTTLADEWRLRAHNEYLTLLISFGVLGLLWSLFSWWWPAYANGAWRDPLFIAWAVIFGISCLTDDTIETQAGATFFALYYALLVLAAPERATLRSTP